MAQPGDTITYTYTDGNSVSESVSAVEAMTVDYVDGAGGETSDSGVSGGAGGRAESVVVDLTGVSTVYLWVGGFLSAGRYDGQPGGTSVQGGSAGGDGAGSTEVSLVDKNGFDESGLPVIVGAGGAGGGGSSSGFAGDGGRANSPPFGGAGGDSTPSTGSDGAGAVGENGTSATITQTGTTISGGGSPADTNGEIQITYGATAPPVEENGQEVTGIEVNGQEVTGIEVNGQEI